LIFESEGVRNPALQLLTHHWLEMVAMLPSTFFSLTVNFSL